MVLEDVLKKLEKLNIPIALSSYDCEVSPPFIVYFIDETSFNDDDYSYFRVKTMSIRIELYSEKKDRELENEIENILRFSNLNKTEMNIESEKLYQVAYEFDIYEKFNN